MSGLILPYRNHWPRIAPDVFVAANATVIGNVDIGSEVGVWFGTVIRGDVNEIRIGPRSNIQDGTIVHVTHERHGIYIGADVTIGHAAIVHGCRLEDGCFVGMRACVMDGVVVENRAMVAAGALVTPGKRIVSGELWAGSPAKKMRDLTPAEFAEMERVSALYVSLAREYRSSSQPGQPARTIT
ncbi:MAG: gamma carbonic anhydrase family protein [Rhodospirillaceae bacterium]|nr:gamma carbonic anhydrase family protein [Rhodospirillaceae bacterium]